MQNLKAIDPHESLAGKAVATGSTTKVNAPRRPGKIPVNWHLGEDKEAIKTDCRHYIINIKRYSYN
jgi:hypothetical protein